jgi:hypothetical protein
MPVIDSWLLLRGSGTTLSDCALAYHSIYNFLQNNIIDNVTNVLESLVYTIV